MPRFAILNDNKIVLSVIIAESIEDAIQLTGASCVAAGEGPDSGNIGSTYDEGKFIPPSTAESNFVPETISTPNAPVA